jgi:hypothetical protein
MHRVVKVFLTVCIGFVCSGAVTSAFGDWSQEWTQNYPPEAVGSFTKMEFFIMPGSSSAVTFEAAASISPDPGSSTGWTSVVPNSRYSLLTGPQADTAVPTTYFPGPPKAVFDPDFVLWNGNSVVERQEFKWLGGAWKNPHGKLIKNASGGYDPGGYDRTGADAVPIQSTILLLAPAGLGVFLIRRRISEV